MTYDAKRYAQALIEVCEDKREVEVKTLVSAWLDLIIAQGQKSLLPQIVTELELLFKADQVAVQVETVSVLDKTSRTWLTQYLSTIITGKKVILIEKINSELLAGYLIKYQDKELNLSLKGILTDLREQIAA